MPLSNRPAAAPIGKVKRAVSGIKRRLKRRSKPRVARKPRKAGARKMSAKQRKYFGKRKKR